MRPLPALRLSALLLSVACDPAPPSQCDQEGAYDLVLTGRGFDTADGGMVRLRLVDDDDGRIKESGAVEVVDGAFETRLSCALEGQARYRFHWFLDEMPWDGRCDDGDPAWLEVVEFTDRDVELVSRPGRDADEGACEPF